MPVIMPCYLTQLETTYNPTGNTFHRDGAPVELDMNIQLTETKTLVRQDLYDDYPGIDPAQNVTDSQANDAANPPAEEPTPGG